ncbi:MAG: glucose 1-dehydrogenase [Gammaproteobacteria bacterium]|nr:glucose 1-dehydrogenase [Gammaproteobacteria bacterium]
MRFNNQVALVTGGSRGIGRDIALALAREGADVAVLATTEAGAEATAQDIRALGRRALALACRVQIADEVSAAFARTAAELGPVQLLVNNAGVSQPVSLFDMSEENWDLHMDVNAKSVFLCTQAAARQMREAGGGAVVNIGSIVGQNAIPQTLGYCASKAAVDHMTRVLAIELARYKIRVNCVAPGYIRTDLIEQLAAAGKFALNLLERRTPQRRLGTGADVAAAVIYVASEEAGFMTGQTLTIDGGWTAYGYL